MDEAVVKAPANPSPAALELKASASTDADDDEYDEGDGGLEGIIDPNAEGISPAFSSRSASLSKTLT